jgi:hypothetical protein
MDVVAVFVVDPGSGLQSYYNCSAVSASCAVALFDLALRAVIAWPLLMSLAVIFCSIIVYLVLKRMQAIEKDVAVMESMNEDLKMAKVAAEAADKAKSNFLATVSHEIRLAKALANVCKCFFFFFFLLHCFLRVIPNAACIYKYLGLIGFSVVCGAGLP